MCAHVHARTHARAHIVRGAAHASHVTPRSRHSHTHKTTTLIPHQLSLPLSQFNKSPENKADFTLYSYTSVRYIATTASATHRIRTCKAKNKKSCKLLLLRSSSVPEWWLVLKMLPLHERWEPRLVCKELRSKNVASASVRSCYFVKHIRRGKLPRTTTDSGNHVKAPLREALSCYKVFRQKDPFRLFEIGSTVACMKLG